MFKTTVENINGLKYESVVNTVGPTESVLLLKMWKKQKQWKTQIGFHD